MYETTVKEREVINLRVQKVTWVGVGWRGSGMAGGGKERSYITLFQLKDV